METRPPNSFPPNILLWLAIGSLILILAVVGAVAFFSPDGAFNPRPAVLEVEKTGDWTLSERLTTACEAGRLPPWQCGKHNHPLKRKQDNKQSQPAEGTETLTPWPGHMTIVEY